MVSPKGDGPLPEVGAILGQPVKETKQALYILQDTKIEEQLVSQRKRNSCYTVKNSYFYLILAKRPWSDDEGSWACIKVFWLKQTVMVVEDTHVQHHSIE